MKRSKFIHGVITGVLGSAVGSFMARAVMEQNPVYAVFGGCAVVALVLNIICGPDKE